MKTIFSEYHRHPWTVHLAVRKKFFKATAVFLASAAAILLTGAVSAQNAYFQHNLVSDIAGLADFTDTNLVNPWGIASSGSSPFWVSDNHAGLSTLYNGSGTPQSLVVTIPPPSGGTPPGAPTGIVFNNTSDFIMDSNAVARFIFATEDGTIAAWNVNFGGTGVVKADNSGAGAIYKGLAIGAANGSNYLYAANFFAGTIDVFDGTYTAASLAGSFADPNIPAGFAPFNIQNINGKLFVTYAKQDATKHDDVPGAGNGFINVFDTSGNLLNRFASSNVLNSPWGMVVAPANFGAFSGALLVGNFGNGKINAFDVSNGTPLGTLQDASGNPISIDGLWGLIVGNGGNGGDTRTVYFAAGIPGTNSIEDHGLFGSISAVAPTFASIANKGSAAAVGWVGGTAPFLLQKKVGVSDPTWINVLTTTNRNVTLAEESSSAFFRLQGLATNTVLPFTAYLTAASETPANSSTATGVAALSLDGGNLTYYISFSGLSGVPTASHIHAPATPTNNANVVFPLAPPSSTSGTFSGQLVLTQDQITNFVNGLCYLNIHTGQNPGGEIRGQIVPLHMLVAMNGASEVPAINTTATATGSLTFIGNQMMYEISYSGLSSAATAAHIHGPADPTTSNVVLLPLNTPSGTSGTISGTVSLTPQQLAFLLAGQTYINIHTLNNGNGEIRGQIWPMQFRVNMNGVSEVPSTGSAGTGFGLMNLISNNLSYAFSFTNLSAAAFAGHIHGPADPQHSATVLIPLTVPSATAATFTGNVVLTSQELFYIMSGLTYANIHTTPYPNGEIRGQIVPHN